MRRRRRLAALLLGVGAALLLTELAMFVAEPWLNVGLYEFDPDLGFRVRSHAYGTNEFGFNDRDYPHDDHPASFRILFLGDSYSWAGGRSFNYTNLLEEMWAHYWPEQHVEVVNAGYPMTHTGEQLALLRKFGLRYRPNLVVLGFFCGNDILEANPHRKRLMIFDTPIDVDPRRQQLLLGRPLVWQSRLWACLRQRWQYWTEGEWTFRLTDNRWQLPAGALAAVLPPRSALGGDAEQAELALVLPLVEFLHGHADTTKWFRDDLFLRHTRHMLAFSDPRHVAGQTYAAHIDHVRDCLRAMAELLRRRGIAFVVGLYPHQAQVDAELRQRAWQSGDRGAPLADYDLLRAQRLVGEELAALGVPTVDFTDLIARLHASAPCYYVNDTHLNELGNLALAARWLLRLQPMVR